jgi:hypothetical protein
VTLPGLLKTRKTKILEGSSSAAKSAEGSTFAGFNATAFKLDLGGSKVSAYDSIATYKPEVAVRQAESMLESASGIDQSNALVHSQADMLSTSAGTIRSKPKGPPTASENTLEELRNYITLMDKYSLHNFMIYEGRALTETPEFQSFKRTYQYKWGAINHIINQLEEFFQKHDVKLAIINGPRLFELSKLNMPVLGQKDLYSMITNIDQIEVLIDIADNNQSDNHVQRTVLRVQTLMRGWIARVRFRKLQRSIAASILLQSVIRKFLYRRLAKALLRREEAAGNAKFQTNRRLIGLWWQSRASDPGEDRTRLVIYIPSINISEYLRMDCDNFRAVQNAHISNIFQLADPDLQLVYVTPFLMSSTDKAYHEKLLSLLGISVLPKRLHFVTPEQINYLPQHLSLASALWYSPNALNKVRTFTKRYKSSVIVPTTVTWVEKRIATYLNISLLAPDASIAETISSRSFMKQIFMDSSVNIPLGSHDIYTLDDLYVALSRLISSNVGVGRWVLRLNQDWNNESTVVFDVDKHALLVNLRSEQFNIAGQQGNVGPWFTRDVQLAVRKRVLQMLKKDLAQKVRICRKDIYPDWDYYLRLMRRYGAVAEAEPIEKLGYVDGICFVDPTGAVHGCKGVEVVQNDQYQVENYLFPQSITPRSALEGATTAIAQNLFERFSVVGYVTVQFMSFWDPHDNLPRLWAVGLQLGMRGTHGALGTLAVMPHKSPAPMQMPLSLMPEIPEGTNACCLIRLFSVKLLTMSCMFLICRQILLVHPDRGAQSAEVHPR